MDDVDEVSEEVDGVAIGTEQLDREDRGDRCGAEVYAVLSVVEALLVLVTASMAGYWSRRTLCLNGQKCRGKTSIPF